MDDQTPLVRGESAAREAMMSLGRPGAIAWFAANHPHHTSGFTPDKPYTWWIGFDRELGSVSGTA